MPRRRIAEGEPIEFLVRREEEPPLRRQRSQRATPHERGRVARRMSVTFPDAGWTETVRDLAQRWQVRPADVLVLAVARLMADLAGGEEVEGPVGTVGFQDRAGEVFSLPWEPEVIT